MWPTHLLKKKEEEEEEEKEKEKKMDHSNYFLQFIKCQKGSRAHVQLVSL